jgi:membrane associated rhomboid family serine protease
VLPLKDNVPTARFPIVTVILIALNFAVFVWELTLPTDQASNLGFQRAGVSKRDEALARYGTIPYRLTHPGKDCGVTGHGGSSTKIVCQGTPEFQRASQAGQVAMLDSPPWWVTVFTAMFIHAGWLHIIGNMLFLWIFGNNVEDSVGRLRFLLFYFLSGIAATALLTLFTPDSAEVLFGASGAIAGVLGGYILLYPRSRVLTLIFLFLLVTLIEIPAVIMLGIWFILQALPGLGHISIPLLTSSGVAYVAHVGGFLFGLALIKPFVRWARGLRPRVAA